MKAMANGAVTVTDDEWASIVLLESDERERGQAGFREWAETAHPHDLQLAIAKIGKCGRREWEKPWLACQVPDLREKLKAQGRNFTVGFLDAAGREWNALAKAFAYCRHRQGIKDGYRWANAIATPEQILQLRDFPHDSTRWELFTEGSFSESWTPAHGLLFYLRGGQWPRTDDGDVISDSAVFRDFWQPVVDESLDKLLFILADQRGRHKLQVLAAV